MAAPIYKGGRPYFKPGVRFGNNVGIFNGSAAPVDGTSGTLVGVAGPGSIYMRTNGAVYVNTNTKASPTWVSLGVGATDAALTTPAITGGSMSGVTNSDFKVLAATADYDTTTTPATLTGFSWTVAASGVYIFDVELNTTMTTTGGLTVNFKLTTATLTSIRYNTYAATATDNSTAVSTTGTTTTDGTKVFDSKTAAYTRVRIFGSMVVNAGGTFAWQACQNTAAGTTDISHVLIGSTAKMTQVA